ncbi:MAG TPA: hypothetical protein VF784_11430, partial [Anaerolineales bacterium]
GLHTVSACVLIWFLRARNARSLRDGALVALGVILLTSPWWGSVLAQHGLVPFQSALNAGGHSGLFWIPWLTMDFAEERFATILTVLGLIGFAVQCVRKDWFLPVWLLVPFAIEPRSATAIAALPLAILAGLGLAEFVLPKIASLASSSLENAEWPVLMSGSKAVRIVTGYVLFSAFLGAFAYDISLSAYVIPGPSLQAMQWVRSTTPAAGRFLVLTGRGDPFSDPTAEWFPELTGRTSENTIQGQEWTLGRQFLPFLGDLSALQACLNAGPSCLDTWSRAHHVAFDYVYIEKSPQQNIPAPSRLLLFQLRQDPNYQLIFENTEAAVFRKK